MAALCLLATGRGSVNITIKSDGDCWYPSPKPSDMESASWWKITVDLAPKASVFH